jgi:thiosulfate/3-mercaptopyruvate sulfurtransferase
MFRETLSGVSKGVLVTTDELFQYLQQPNVRVAEVDWDPSAAYHQGHVKGAVLIDWRRDMNNPLIRDVVDKNGFEELMGRLGIANDTTVLLYGDFNNWFATYAFWVFKYYGHEDVRIVDGGRKKLIEEGREFTKEVPSYPPTKYTAKPPDERIRVYLDTILKLQALRPPNITLVDVRSPAEFKGEILAPPEYPGEGGQRGGHIPGAKNIPWGKAVRDDGTFKSLDELRAIYTAEGVTPDKTIITYCRIGERASHTFFVLKYLLGYPDVRVYTGSFSEYGNLEKVPIER